ncbi:metal-response element-binding transcription factor 2-like isoform X2 [Ornithodoros turicata]|uniref:metal-response element-binding transcription factor 2-like isoform X2 n=1 Tax=Ornithodoros turicata TaxID=34597 RepID=UPI003138CF86
MLLYAMSRGEIQGGHELRPRIRHKKPKRMLRSWYSFLNQEQQNNKLRISSAVDETVKQPSYKNVTSSQASKEKEVGACGAAPPLAVDCNGFAPLKYTNHISHVEKAVNCKNHTLDYDPLQGGRCIPANSVEVEDEDEETEEEEEDSDLMCSVCSKGESEPPNEIVICDTCNKGFHQLCHLPKISDQVLLPNIPWHCRHCVPVGSVRVSVFGPIFFSVCHKVLDLRCGHIEFQKSAKNYRNGMRVQTFKLGLPYDIKSLEWDSHHRTNLRNRYCYCGGPGEWNKKMLQCLVCQQWFHEACIQSLETPLLYGDRFYNFTCSVCNNGPEIVKRLPLAWVDVTHLILYNMNVENPKKNYDLDEDILPFLNSIWLALQLPPDMSRSSPRERRCNIFRCLDTDESRFKATKDMKKRRLLWCLRTKTVPPLPPEVSQPENKDNAGKTEDEVFTKNAPARRSVPQKTHSPSPDREDSRKRRNNSHAKNNSTSRKLPNGLVRHQNSKAPVKATAKAHLNGTCRVPPNGAVGGGSAAAFLETFIPPPPDFGGSNHPFYDLDKGRPKKCRSRRPAKRKLLSQKDIRTASKRRRRRRSASVSTTYTAATEDSSHSDTSDMEVEDVAYNISPRWRRRSRGNREVNSVTGNMKLLARRMTADGKIQFLIEREA